MPYVEKGKCYFVAIQDSCVRTQLSCAFAERDIYDNNIWIRPIFTGWTDEKLLVFHTKYWTLLFSLTHTHHWNRLVFTQCYNSTGQDWRHNSDRFQISRGQILEAILHLNSVLWGISHTLIHTMCESKYARLCIIQNVIPWCASGQQYCTVGVLKMLLTYVFKLQLHL